MQYQKKETNFSPAYVEAMDSFRFNDAFEHAWAHIQNLNKRIDEEKPWELAKKGESEKLENVLSELVNGILHANLELSPFLPSATKKIERIFSDKEIAPPETPLFPKER